MTNIIRAKHAAMQLVELADKLQRLRQSLRHLVSQVESALSTLEAPSLTQIPSRSTRSARSKKDTNGGVHDVTTEAPISFREASEMIPTHPSPATISRWCSVGCRGVKLASRYYGGRRKTSREAVLRFLTACREGGFEGMSNAYGLERAMAAKELLEQHGHDDDDTDSSKKSAKCKSVTAGNSSGRRKSVRPAEKRDRINNKRSKH